MLSAPIALPDSPDFKRQITHVIYGHAYGGQIQQQGQLERYFAYYLEELDLLRKGISDDSWQTKCLAVKTCEDIFHVINVLRDNGESRRTVIRQLLSSRLPSENVTALDRSINLAIRLWLMVNTQEPMFEGLRHEANFVEWDDESTLRDYFQSLFPCARWQVTAQSSRLGPHFTAAFMRDVCGLKVEWTTSLHDHLRLDRRRKALRIFPYKCHLQALIDSHQSMIDREQLPIPYQVLIETKMSLDLLFPFWDDRTTALLAEEKQDFNDYGPFRAGGSLMLSDFDHWRDRLLELHEEIFQSPPVSWAQLWRDRRNPQQYWTFWVALMILVLTLLSTVTTIVQAWASLKALERVSIKT
ncbi:MAG: hypothetical protein Q9226_003786 [Calogaya cf. arnoldii]